MIEVKVTSAGIDEEAGTSEPGLAETAPCLEAIPGLPSQASQRLLQVLAAEPAVRQVWLYGSRAMGRQRQGSDIDLTLVGEELSGDTLLGLMQTIDDLMLPWSVDLSLHARLDAEVRNHVERIGRLLRLPGR